MVLGFDAMDPSTVRAMAAAGHLPAFQEALSRGAAAPITNPYGFFINNTWTAFFTGWGPARTRWHATDEITAGTYRHRRAPLGQLRGQPFWRDLDRRIAALDVPHTVAAEPAAGGIEVSEWGSHDRHEGPRLLPAADGGELLERFGYHPVFGVEPDLQRDFAPDDYVHREGFRRSGAEEEALAHAMADGAVRKTVLSRHVLARGGWDLFISVAGESHAIGHQQWHLHDASHPRHDTGLVARCGDPVASVYALLDRSLSEHLALAGPDTLVLVILSHGMGPHYDGGGLLTELCRRLDVVRRGGPLEIRGTVSTTHASDEERARQAFFRSPNNDHIGAIRLNVRGREPAGIVEPTDVTEVTEWLRAELLALINVRTGRAAVRAVELVSDYHPRSPDDSFPDLFIVWNHEADITGVSSPRIGTVAAGSRTWRTGDHRPRGLLIALGPGIRGPVAMPEVPMLDLAPSIRQLLGAPAADLDGRPIAWLGQAR